MGMLIDDLIFALQSAKEKGIKDVEFSFFVGTTRVEMHAENARLTGKLVASMPYSPKVAKSLTIRLEDDPQNNRAHSLRYALKRAMQLGEIE